MLVNGSDIYYFIIMSSTSSSFGSFGGQWSAVKLEAVDAYFTAFNQALSRTPFIRVYIDAFAGGGRVNHKTQKRISQILPLAPDLFSNDRGVENFETNSPADELEESEAEDFRHGSPLLALETVPGFDEFIFIERDPDTLKQLERQVRGAPALNGRPVQFICEDANIALSRICSPDWKKKRRATIFLDPFALQIRWSTLEAIALTKGMDMWMLFPAMAVNRMLPRHAEVPEVWAERLNETFGDSSWRQEFYGVAEVLQNDDLFPHLLPAPKEIKLNDPFGRLSRYVIRRLKTVFADAVDEPLVLKTQSGSPLFLLCFAVANQNGAPIAKRIAGHIIKGQKYGR